MSSSSLSTSSITVTTGTTTMTLQNIGAGLDLKLPVCTAESSMPLAQSPPQTHLSSELPMDVDTSSDSVGGHDFTRTIHIKTEADLGGGDATNCVFDIPTMQMDMNNASDSSYNFHPFGVGSSEMVDNKSDTTFNFHSLGDNGSPVTTEVNVIDNGDQDLTWLDLVMPSSSDAATTPVSSTPPTGIEGVLGTALSKDPFPFNLFDLTDVSTPTELHHLEDDVWDNIPVNE